MLLYVSIAVTVHSQPNRRIFVDFEQSSFRLALSPDVRQKLMHEKGHIPLAALWGSPLRDPHEPMV